MRCMLIVSCEARIRSEVLRVPVILDLSVSILYGKGNVRNPLEWTVKKICWSRNKVLTDLAITSEVQAFRTVGSYCTRK
jgi:hypothetical protein